MKKAELEALLMDCDRTKALCEQMNRYRPCTPVSTGTKAKVSLQHAPHNTQHPGPSSEDVKNNLRYSKPPYSYTNLFQPGGTVADQLRQAIEKYRANPSLKGASFIEMAINRIGISAQSDKGLLLLVDEAKQVLSKKFEVNKEGGFEGDNVTGTIFEHSDFHGSSLFLNLLGGGGLLTGYVSLSGFHFNDKVSSAELTTSVDEVGGRLFLFQNDRFLGRYVKLDADSDGNIQLPSLSSFMDDRTSSVLIYRKVANEISVALGDLVPASAITSLISSQDEISSRGDPIFTWDLFPDGKDGHPNETGKMYVYIRIPVTIDVPYWPFDYDAEIRFWIYPYIDQNGNLHAWLDYYGAWVEGGLLTDSVLANLMGPQGIQNSLGQVGSLLDQVVSAANVFGPYSSIYLLPGRNEAKGNTDDDVTIVLIHGMPSPPGPIL